MSVARTHVKLISRGYCQAQLALTQFQLQKNGHPPSQGRLAFYENMSRTAEFSCQPVSQIDTAYRP